MKRLMIPMMIIAMLTSGVAVSATEDVNIQANDEKIRYIGRWVDNGNGAYEGSFEGEIIVKFKGTALRASKKSSGTVYVQVDGGEYKSAELSSTSLCKGLEDTVHTVRIFAAAQLSFPKVTGFTLTNGGEFLMPDKNTTIEFIGDSILEGYVRQGENSSVISYGTHTAARLGFDRNIVAFGGITVTANYGNPDKTGMPNRYYMLKEYSATEPTSEAWDTNCFVPDIIVVNLGANDSAVPDASFILSYEMFLTKLRKSYPDTVIFVMTVFHNRKTEQVKKAYENQKDSKMFLVDTSKWGTLETADGLHITADAHKFVGERLAEEISATLDEMQKAINATKTPSTENVTEAPTANSGEASKKANSGGGRRAVIISVITVLALMGVAAGVTASKKKK